MLFLQMIFGYILYASLIIGAGLICLFAPFILAFLIFMKFSKSKKKREIEVI